MTIQHEKFHGKKDHILRLNEINIQRIILLHIY